MTDDDILTDLETFNDAMVHFKEAVDGKGKSFYHQCNTSRNLKMREICSHLEISGYVTLLEFSITNRLIETYE